MYVDAALAPVVGTLTYVTVIVAGLAEVPGAVTDAAAFGDAGGAAVQVAPCANTTLLANGKQTHPMRTPKVRTFWTEANRVIAVLS